MGARTRGGTLGVLLATVSFTLPSGAEKEGTSICQVNRTLFEPLLPIKSSFWLGDPSLVPRMDGSAIGALSAIVIVGDKGFCQANVHSKYCQELMRSTFVELVVEVSAQISDRECVLRPARIAGEGVSPRAFSLHGRVVIFATTRTVFTLGGVRTPATREAPQLFHWGRKGSLAGRIRQTGRRLAEEAQVLPLSDGATVVFRGDSSPSIQTLRAASRGSFPWHHAQPLKTALQTCYILEDEGRCRRTCPVYHRDQCHLGVEHAHTACELGSLRPRAPAAHVHGDHGGGDHGATTNASTNSPAMWKQSQDGHTGPDEAFRVRLVGWSAFRLRAWVLLAYTFSPSYLVCHLRVDASILGRLNRRAGGGGWRCIECAEMATTSSLAARASLEPLALHRARGHAADALGPQAVNYTNSVVDFELAGTPIVPTVLALDGGPAERYLVGAVRISTRLQAWSDLHHGWMALEDVSHALFATDTEHPFRIRGASDLLPIGEPVRSSTPLKYSCASGFLSGDGERSVDIQLSGHADVFRMCTMHFASLSGMRGSSSGSIRLEFSTSEVPAAFMTLSSSEIGHIFRRV